MKAVGEVKEVLACNYRAGADRDLLNAPRFDHGIVRRPKAVAVSASTLRFAILCCYSKPEVAVTGVLEVVGQELLLGSSDSQEHAVFRYQRRRL